MKQTTENVVHVILGIILGILTMHFPSMIGITFIVFLFATTIIIKLYSEYILNRVGALLLIGAVFILTTCIVLYSNVLYGIALTMYSIFLVKYLLTFVGIDKS